MIVVLRCSGGNIFLTVAQFSLVFSIPGRQRAGHKRLRLSVVELMNEFSFLALPNQEILVL